MVNPSSEFGVRSLKFGVRSLKFAGPRRTHLAGLLTPGLLNFRFLRLYGEFALTEFLPTGLLDPFLQMEDINGLVGFGWPHAIRQT